MEKLTDFVQHFWIFSVNSPPPVQFPPVKRSSEIITELIGTNNQIAVFYSSNCN